MASAPLSPTTLAPSQGHFYHTVTLGILDKVTARVLQKKVKIGQPITFGTLTIEAKRCWHSTSHAHPETKVFLIIQDTPLNQSPVEIFKGWMFASAPSISTLEHPVYDVWVIGADAANRLHTSQSNGGQMTEASPLEQKQALDQILGDLLKSQE